MLETIPAGAEVREVASGGGPGELLGRSPVTLPMIEIVAEQYSIVTEDPDFLPVRDLPVPNEDSPNPSGFYIWERPAGGERGSFGPGHHLTFWIGLDDHSQWKLTWTIPPEAAPLLFQSGQSGQSGRLLLQADLRPALSGSGDPAVGLIIETPSPPPAPRDRSQNPLTPARP